MKPMYRLICPQCGKSDGVVEVVYGFPTLEGEQAAQRGEVVLGGCILDEGQPPIIAGIARSGFSSRGERKQGS